MTDAAEAIERYRESLAAGERLFSALRMTDVEVDGADLAVQLEVDLALTGPLGALQGGLVATLADVVGGRIAMQGAPEGTIVVTSDLAVHYLAPVLNGPAHAVGHALKRGRRTVVVRSDIYDGPDGPLAAVCTMTFAMVTPPPTP